MRAPSSPLHPRFLERHPLPFMGGLPLSDRGAPTPPGTPGGKPLQRPVSWLQRNRINILLVGLALIAALSASVQLMTPALAQTLSNYFPDAWVRSSSEQMLANLDARIFAPARTPLAEQKALQDRFAALSAPAEGAPPYRLLFRHSLVSEKALLSLPGGEIIVSDQFLDTVTDPAEQIALLCHELGHLQYQDALRGAIEQNLYSMLFATAFNYREMGIRLLGKGMESAAYTHEDALSADRYARVMLQANRMNVQILREAIEHSQSLSASPAQTLKIPLARHPHFAERLSALQNLQ